MRILIRLPKETKLSHPFNRANYGQLVIEDEDKVLLGPFPCLGKGGGNKRVPSSDWRKRNQDTPTGEYIGTIARWNPAETYGVYPVIKLDPIGGNALEAEKLGRSGLAIHGGRSQEILYSTQGCVRVFDRNMKEIIAKLNQLGINEINVTVEETSK